MFGMAKRVTAERLAGDLAARVIDPLSCREAAARLTGRPSPDPLASCEMAFAGAATLRHVFADTQPPAIAARMIAAVDAAVADAFSGAHTPQTLAHYGAGSLALAAAEAVSRYQADAFWSRRLAETMAARLGMAEASPPEMARIFSRIVETAVLAISRVRIV
ncbi:MAG: hypothetical protein ACR2FH_02295 [Caulobacteraceae bacterium]